MSKLERPSLRELPFSNTESSADWLSRYHRYWLPSLLKHKHVALRFVPQAEYEQAAVLRITPSPDVVHRIFMIFQGFSLEEAESSEWVVAKQCVNWPSSNWRHVVGMDESDSSMSDKTKFRVLEWGGMEVKKWFYIWCMLCGNFLLLILFLLINWSNRIV